MISEKLLEKLEKLSCLSVKDKEKSRKQISEVLDFVENLNNIDLKEELDSNDEKTPLREDLVIQSDISKDVLRGAKNTSSDFFIVPKIV